MSTEMIQSAYIGLCLRYAEGEDVRHLLSDNLRMMSMRSCADARNGRKGAEDA